MKATAGEDRWHPARLIPVAGIRGQEEQERRATSALLAVIRAVPEFGHALIDDLGAPKGRISTFTEIQLKDAEGKLSIPDGAVVVERGKTVWRALVEVKTGVAELGGEQVSRYLEMARDHGFNTVITISNQITATSGDVPYTIDRRKTKRVDLHHLSWWRIITEAVLQHRHRGVSDPDQAWILGELIAYLDHDNSGASGFEGMGDAWVNVRDAARQGTIQQAARETRAVAARWEQFLDYLALGLSQDLGRDVATVRPRGQDLETRLAGLTQALADPGTLAGALRVPDAIGSLAIVANLRAQQVSTSVTFDAPKDGRPSARVNWLLRQLQDAPPDLRIETAFAGARDSAVALLKDAAPYPQRLLSSVDPKREPRAFTLTLTRKMGLKAGKGAGSFAGDTKRQTVDFYGEIVQNLKAWHPRAPKLPDQPESVPETPQAEPPPFISHEREIGEATGPSESPA
ncbi:MAG: hypothetical protein R3C15_19675 [Thermoleophilia bacterium]